MCIGGGDMGETRHTWLALRASPCKEKRTAVGESRPGSPRRDRVDATMAVIRFCHALYEIRSVEGVAGA